MHKVHMLSRIYCTMTYLCVWYELTQKEQHAYNLRMCNDLLYNLKEINLMRVLPNNFLPIIGFIFFSKVAIKLDLNYGSIYFSCCQIKTKRASNGRHGVLTPFDMIFKKIFIWDMSLMFRYTS